MSIGQLLKIERRHAVTRAADAELASHLPGLGLPYMSETAELGRDFLWLVVQTGDVEILIASRLLDMRVSPDPVELFAGVPRPLWERGLRAMFD